MIRVMEDKDIDRVLEIIKEHSEDDFCFAHDFYNRPHGDRHHDYVYERLGKVVGLCSVSPDSYNWHDILWISWFYVDADYRRQGIGTRLLNSVIKTIKGTPTRKLYLSTDSHPSYENAVRMYKKMGFKIEGVLKDYYEPEYHQILMGKKLL